MYDLDLMTPIILLRTYLTKLILKFGLGMSIKFIIIKTRSNNTNYAGKKAILNDIFPEGLHYDGSTFELIKLSPAYKKIILHEKSNIERIEEKFKKLKSEFLNIPQPRLTKPMDKAALSELFNEVQFRIKRINDEEII